YQGTSRRQAGSDPASHRFGSQFQRHHRSRPHEGCGLGRRIPRCQISNTEIPDDLKDAAVAARLEMIEACAELDEQATEDYLNGKEISNETIKTLLRKAVVTGAFFPVLCGSAFKNKGVQPLLDAVVDSLPSP